MDRALETVSVPVFPVPVGRASPRRYLGGLEARPLGLNASDLRTFSDSEADQVGLVCRPVSSRCARGAVDRLGNRWAIERSGRAKRPRLPGATSCARGRSGRPAESVICGARPVRRSAAAVGSARAGALGDLRTKDENFPGPPGGCRRIRVVALGEITPDARPERRVGSGPHVGAQIFTRGTAGRRRPRKIGAGHLDVQQRRRA